MADIGDLARRAMVLARNQIVLHLRFMDMAVFRLQPVPADTTLATEGARLFYGEKHVLRRYLRYDQAGLARDYLHALLHCVFRHPFIASLVDAPRWDVACDMAVTDVILSLQDEHFALPGDEARRRVLDGLRAEVGPLTAERLYARFAERPPEPGWADLFGADDHVLWHKPKQARQMAEGRDGGEDGEGEPQKRAPNDASPGERPDDGEKSRRQDGGGQEDSDEKVNPMGQPSPSQEDKEQPAAAASKGDAAEAEGEGKDAMRASESDGQTGRTVGRYDEDHHSDQRNVGKGMDTDGRDGEAAGSQSRSDRTEGGLDAPHALGISGDSADAGSQSDASETGGSGSGLNDAFLEDDAASQNPPPDLREDPRDTPREQLEREWKDAGERIQTDLETFSRRRGESAGRLMEQLRELNREKIDYAEFLRKFCVLGEAAELNPDEFDSIFYTYGLRLYGNLPLIEPQETREVLRVRDFVIAIDTSGSTSGELVKRFLETTWGILKGEENFFRRMNLHIVQCDAEIQEAVRVTDQREFDAYMADFSVKGLGGTDFRPVFRYVDELQRQGAFTRLKGLIYFTDGQGTYPARKPDYETAFIFQRGTREPPAVPPWAMRVVLE